jgi:hypothetical protein
MVIAIYMMILQFALQEGSFCQSVTAAPVHQVLADLPSSG